MTSILTSDWSHVNNTDLWLVQATGIKKMENQLNFLKSVPLLSTFPHDILAKISDVLELEVYKKGETSRIPIKTLLFA